MSGPDFSPNFDWMSRREDEKQPLRSGSPPPLPPPNPPAEVPDSPEHVSQEFDAPPHALEEGKVPDVEDKTLILPRRHEALDAPPTEALNLPPTPQIPPTISDDQTSGSFPLDQALESTLYDSPTAISFPQVDAATTAAFAGLTDDEFDVPPPDADEDDHVVSHFGPETDDEQSPTTVFQTDQLQASLGADSAFASLAAGTVFEDPADPGSQLPEMTGHTEVLRAEDIVKAKESWPVMDVVPPAAFTVQEGDGWSTVSDGGSRAAAEKIYPGYPATPTTSRAFLILASYASAITIALISLVLRQAYENGHPQQLESLPDIAPQKERELTYAPPNITLPAGHTLRLGQKQRYGNILVEPLEIVQEPASFVHYSGDQTRERPATGPLWKLKIRLTNVSDDQEIAPLDRLLVLRWVTAAGRSDELSNYFITERGTKDRDARMVQLYRLPVTSDWDLLGQNLGKSLRPGESYETYLASSDEGLAELPENLVWRVQIRKGYSPAGNGVTTIFEVAFNKRDVHQESSPRDAA